VSFWPNDKFAPNDPKFRLIFGEANEVIGSRAKSVTSVLGMAWLYAGVKRMVAGPLVISVALACGISLGGGSSFAASVTAPTGGKIELFATPSGNTGGGTVLITGAIGDYGKTESVNKNGTPDPNGNYGKAVLHQGTIEVNLTALNEKENNLPQTIFNLKSCSAHASVSAPVPVVDGTGLYTGISGTLMFSTTFAFIGPRVTSGPNKGQCSKSNNAPPLAQWISVMGSGTVGFS
jgi:hypothetical protein